MADKALENAERMREELAANINKAQAEIDGWRRDLRRVDLFIADWHALVETSSLTQAPSDAVGTAVEKIDRETLVGHVRVSVVKSPRRHNSPKEIVVEAARQAIELHGEPMSRTDLYRTLVVDYGLTIEGKDPEMVLSTMLWRMGRVAKIVRLKSGGYWLAERPWPNAFYDPALNDMLEATDETEPVES